MRVRLIVLFVTALAVVATSFGVAAAGERKPSLVLQGDCGCTGAARAKDRVERGLLHYAPPAQSPRE